MLSSMWEPGASLLLTEPPVIPSQWGTRAAVSRLLGWENNPPCLENKGHGGKPLTGGEVSKGGNILNNPSDASVLCATLVHMHSKLGAKSQMKICTQLTNSHESIQKLSHTHTCVEIL